MERCLRNINRSKVYVGVLFRQNEGLYPNPTACFQNRAACWIERVMVEQFRERTGLIDQPTAETDRNDTKRTVLHWLRYAVLLLKSSSVIMKSALVFSAEE
jgi:hypothetical protein